MFLGIVFIANSIGYEHKLEQIRRIALFRDECGGQTRLLLGTHGVRSPVRFTRRPSSECLADVAVDVDWLACARVFLDVEPEHHLAVLLEAVLRNVDIVVHLPPGVHDREEVVLHFVGLVHAADFEMLAVLRDAEDDPPSSRIGERGGRFEDGLRQRGFGGFALGVAPLAGA